jgi:hypothetical protein
MKETIIPPPPIPAITDRDIKIVSIIVPIISIGNIGNRPLCRHLRSASSLIYLQFRNPLLPQSESFVHGK